MKKLLCERPRRGSSNPSLKTGKRLNPNLDYDSLDYDWGPSRLSIGRIRQFGYESKILSENFAPLYNFLYTSIGRDWNEVYSEIRENLSPNKAIDFHVLFHLDHMVEINVYIGADGHVYDSVAHGGRTYQVRNLYVHPETGKLCVNKDEPKAPKKKDVNRLVWHHNVFNRVVTYPRATCGCVHFFVNKPSPFWMKNNHDGTTEERRRLVFYDSDKKDAKCIHGNFPLKFERWDVTEYAYHSPDEVYKVIHFTDYGAALRYGLSVTNPVHKIYYRDVPEELKEPYVVRRKTANKKEMKIIRHLLDN
jgi:hypothetical protein